MRSSPQDKENNMGYLIAAYFITAAALVGYGAALMRERKRYRSQGPSEQ